MHIDHGGAEPENTPQFRVIASYADTGWCVDLTAEGSTRSCTIDSVEVVEGGAVVRATPWEFEGEAFTVLLDSITAFYVH